MKQHGVKKILTHCPHCLNSLKSDYSQFGGDYEVVHHTEFLKELVDSGRLSFKPDTDEADEVTTRPSNR